MLVSNEPYSFFIVLKYLFSFFLPLFVLCVGVIQTSFNFFGALSLIKNNSGKTSSGVKGVLCNHNLSIFNFYCQYFANPCLTFKGYSITKFAFSFNLGTTSYILFQRS